MGAESKVHGSDALERAAKKARTATSEGTATSASTTRAMANFLRDEVPFGFAQACQTEAKGRQGFEVASDLMETKELCMEPIPEDAKLETHGLELLDVREELKAAGVWEDNIDPTNKDQRVAIGKVLIAAAEARFGPGKRAVHMADTSRVSGASVYGEVTVRDTTKGAKLRAAHQAFHIDKFLPGVAKFWSHAGTMEGAQDFVETYWQHWQKEFSELGLSQDDTVKCVGTASPGLVNLWVSLTPGEIEQMPLALADCRTLALGEGDLDKISTVPVTFPALKDTLTLLRSSTVHGTRWLWRPKMRFGEVLLFHCTQTPHSAVVLKDTESEKPRQSAEMRLFMFDKK